MKNNKCCLPIFVMLIVVTFVAYSAAQTKPAPAQAAADNPNEVMHIYECETIEGHKDTEVEEAARVYFEALRELDGGKDLKMKVLWPVAVTNLGTQDFKIVLISPSFTSWGRMWDAYKDDTKAAQFEDLQGVADCNDSAVWESENILPKK